MTEMSMEVTNFGRTREVICDEGRLKKFFQVDFARPGQKRAARAHGFPARCGCGPRHSKRMAQAAAYETRQEIAEVFGQPLEQRSSRKGGRGRKISRLRAYQVNYLVPLVFVLRLYYEELQLKPRLLKPIDLARDKSFRQARESFQNISHARAGLIVSVFRHKRSPGNRKSARRIARLRNPLRRARGLCGQAPVEARCSAESAQSR